MTPKWQSTVRKLVRALFVAMGMTLLVPGMLAIIVGASEAGVFPRHFHLVHPWTHGCTNVEEAALLVGFGTAFLWAGISLLWLNSLNNRLTELGEIPKLDYVGLSKVNYTQSDHWILD